MRVVPCVMLVACLCVGPVGCATFSKRSGGSEHAKAGSDKGKPAAPVEASDPLVNHASAPALAITQRGTAVR